MTAFLISVVVVAMALLAMSIGVIFGREPIRGSCGGVMGRCGLCSGSGACKKKRADAVSEEGAT